MLGLNKKCLKNFGSKVAYISTTDMDFLNKKKAFELGLIYFYFLNYVQTEVIRDIQKYIINWLFKNLNREINV